MSIRDGLWASVGYIPHAEELVIHNDKHRFKLVTGGERAGKSLLASKEMLWWLLDYAEAHTETGVSGKRVVRKKGGLWWLVGPTYELTRQEFAYLMDDLLKIGLIKQRDASFPRQGQCSISLPFGTVETKSADDAKKIAASAPDGVVVCETGQLDYYSWLKLHGRCTEKRAPMLATGKFEADSQPWHREEWNHWQIENARGGRSFSLPTWSNIHDFPGGRQDPEILRMEATLPPDLFTEWIEGKPVKLHTLVFPEFEVTKHVVQMDLRDRVSVVWEMEDDCLVRILLPRYGETHLFVDPGYHGAYAVLAVKIIDGNVFAFDEVYEQGKSARQIIEICRSQSWWGTAKRGVIDVAGKQHHEDMSHAEIWAAEGHIALTSQRVGITDGLDRYRSFLAAGADERQRLYYSPKCANAISEHGKYKYRAMKEGRRENEHPIDTNNHAIKAVTYGLIAHFGYVERVRSDVLWESPFPDWTGMKKEERGLPWPLRT